MKNCCNHSKKDKQCIRKSDQKTFKLPRRFSRKKCRKPKGFTMRSSCAPYKDCFIKTKKQKGGKKKKNKNKTSYFSAGCFWGVEEKFSKLDGVKSTQVGYMGGKSKNPTYEKVSNGNTGHAETVKIVYDPDIISYDNLLKFFFSIHDPTTLNRQGLDIGNQYRSIAFYNNKKEKELIHKYKKANKKIVTELIKTSDFKFYEAEKYHQKYNEKNKQKGGSINKYLPKLRKIDDSHKKYKYHLKDPQKKRILAINEGIRSESKRLNISLKKAAISKKGRFNILRIYRKNNNKKDCKKLTNDMKYIDKKYNLGKTKNICQKGGKKKTKKQFLYNPKNPKKSFDVYIDKNPKDTIPIKYKTLQDVKNTIKKLERLYKTNKYPHKRIWKVGMI